VLSRELIDLIHSRDAVAIIGSGISVDAGLPSWEAQSEKAEVIISIFFL